MIRHAFLIALALSAAGCKRNRQPEAAAAGADPKPFTLACNGQVTDEMGQVRGALKFSLTVDIANTETLISNIGADRPGILPSAYDNRNGDVLKVATNDRLITADLNTAGRQDADNKVAIDRRTGKFTGPDSNGACIKAALIPMPAQKF